MVTVCCNDIIESMYFTTHIERPLYAELRVIIDAKGRCPKHRPNVPQVSHAA